MRWLMFTRIGNFFIDQWLWNITWDWYHIPIDILFMVIFFKFFLRLNIVASVLIALSSTITAFVVYTGFVIGVLMYLFNFRYHEVFQSYTMVADPLHACLYVGIIYTILQSIFISVLHNYYPVPRIKMIIVISISNLLTVGMVYLVVPHSLM